MGVPWVFFSCLYNIVSFECVSCNFVGVCLNFLNESISRVRRSVRIESMTIFPC